ncbi:IclR family transcriptional regulator [Streptomyces sp. S465]|uniref:IclR family transcriptional regulator n=1 Tax=Streptomyces sp. S465 TaxID=2979468 RepID=UPI0022A889C5|nr:IclR family transcriptional regulator [Streptomyces sp. S465]WAP59111.1 IclR family transcriptional regulator [Streptomyces sp. S465]
MVPGTQAISVLGKAHLVLGAFDSGSTCLGLSELSRRSGVPKATVHRIGTELVELGYLSRTGDGYQLGWRIFELGRLVPGPAQLRAVARPAMLDLRSATRAVVHLAVPHGTDCCYLERLGGRREAAVVAAVGSTVSLLLTVSGRVLLAHSEDQEDILQDLEAQRANGFLSGDRLDPDALRAELAGIRTRRWATEREQFMHGYKTFAVPIIYFGDERVIATVSATVPADRRDDQQLIHALWATAADIGRSLQRQGTSRTDPQPRTGMAI